DGQSGSCTGWLSFRQPRYWYVRMSMFSEMNRTEPSPKQKFAPPVWFDLKPHVTCQFHKQLAGLMPRAVQFLLQSLQEVRPPVFGLIGQLIGWMVWPWETVL